MEDKQPLSSLETTSLPLLEERATVTKGEVVTGRVRVSTLVETFEETAVADLRSEEVVVTRVPVNRNVEGIVPQIVTRGDLTIIPILEEIIVIEKRLVLREELHIRKKTTLEAIETPVTLRRQRAVIERSDDRSD